MACHEFNEKEFADCTDEVRVPTSVRTRKDGRSGCPR